MKSFKTLGVMIDCSRNAVMSIKYLKEYISLLKKMGYNAVMLYTEDTYEIDGEPLFGHMRGRYSKNELKELDAFCVSEGIELIPCIQTLAHLNSIFKWREYEEINDCNDILLIDSEQTYALIERMLATISECFSTKRIHIGMDEAHMVGCGKYLDNNGYTARSELIYKHLTRVCEMTAKYDLKPIIWSDMLYRSYFKSKSYYEEPSQARNDEAEEKIPKNLSIAYWDYYCKDYEAYAKKINNHRIINRELMFFGGAWTWRGFVPDNSHSLNTMLPAIKACSDCGIDECFFTMWGDDGSECSKTAIIYTLYHLAQVAQGEDDIDSIKEGFKRLTGYEGDAFMLLDELDKSLEMFPAAPSKMLLYNDLFNGLFNHLCTGGEDEYYKNLAKKIYPHTQSGPFAYMFKSYYALCRVLSVKADLGVRIRQAYKSGDIEALKELVQKECVNAITLIEEFIDVYRNQWMIENKPHGFDVQDMRLGAAIQRIKSCSTRILDYVAGKADSIPELDEPEAEGTIGGAWSRCQTANVLSHYF